MASIQDILRPITLTEVISRMAATTTILAQRFGVQVGGTNELYMGHGRQGSYRVYNHVRKVALGRAPGTAAGRRARNPVAEVPFVYPRMHEEIQLPAEELHNLSKIDDPRMRDEAGATYIRMQTGTQAEIGGNWRTMQLAGMMRDQLYVTVDGDDWYFNFTSAGSDFRINFGMPSGNTAQLDMEGNGDIIDVGWENPDANIPLHLLNMNKGLQHICGGRLALIACPTNVWNAVTNNDHVASQAGIAATPYQTFERQVGVGPDGTPINAFAGRLACMPGLEWFITDEVLDIGPAGGEEETQLIEDDHLWFGVEPIGSKVIKWYKGSEPIAEYDNGPETVKVGFSAWSKKTSNPTSTEIFMLDNGLIVNHVPGSNGYAKVMNIED